MDSHPHIVISHELDVFTKLSEGILSPIKQDIFNAVWRNAMQAIYCTMGLELCMIKDMICLWMDYIKENMLPH